MNFNLSHENITTALREYMDKRDIIPGKPFNFRIATGRKGNNRCNAFIETIESNESTEQSVPEVVLGLSEYMPDNIEQPTPDVPFYLPVPELGLEEPSPSNVYVAPIEETAVPSKEEAKSELVKQFFAQEVNGVTAEEGAKAKPFKKLFAN